MSYTALYRKFRPDNFEDVKGQQHIVTTLKNQIEADRKGHAYLLCGTRGTGKTTIAKIFAKAVNCTDIQAGNPCGKCDMCKSIAAGTSMNVIEIDAASNNGVDNIRELVDEVSYSPAEGKYKVYIIDEVHMLSIGAFNALLKTLEEPPSYVIFILATTESHKIPITILSRCQRYDFKRITIQTITERLQELIEIEEVQVEEKGLRYIAKAADGSMRDALSLLDQCIAFHFGKMLTYENVLDVLGAVDTEVFGQLLLGVCNKDIIGLIELLEEIIMQGREITQFVSEFTWYLRNLLLIKSSDNIEEVIDASPENILRLKEEAEHIDRNAIMRYIRIFSELSGQIKYSAQKRILVEMAIIKICTPSMETDFDSILARVRDLELKIEKGIVVNKNQSADNNVEQGDFVKVEKKQSIVLTKAIPEDVKLIVERWASIINDIDNPMKMYLKTAKLSLTNDNKLMIVLKDGVHSDFFIKKIENKQKLESILTDIVEKQIEVIIKGLDQEKDFNDNYVNLEEAIKMNIEEEE